MPGSLSHAVYIQGSISLRRRPQLTQDTASQYRRLDCHPDLAPTLGCMSLEKALLRSKQAHPRGLLRKSLLMAQHRGLPRLEPILSSLNVRRPESCPKQTRTSPVIFSVPLAVPLPTPSWATESKNDALVMPRSLQRCLVSAGPPELHFADVSMNP